MEIQTQEGKFLGDTSKLKITFADRQVNRNRKYTSPIITIQRAWRCYLGNRDDLRLTFSQCTITDKHNRGEANQLASSLDSNSHHQSDHDDENSQTESAMTLLSPEENQGGGDANSASDPIDLAEDEQDSSSVQDSVSLNLEADDDLSPTAAPVPSIRPVLDCQEILLDLERETFSSSRFSVDVECESILSDYSELGGPLRDIEREVTFVDKDALRADDSLFPFVLSSSRSEEEILEKRDDETEEEFQRRIRKVNLLSLAQEFAELKKIDAQACPINFHRNQSAKTFGRGTSPLGSRGHSLERSGRTHSKSPLRTSLSSKDLPKTISSMTDAVSVCETGQMFYERRRLSGKEVYVSGLQEDLPVNEARRRNSSADLPVNMRPERCAGNNRTASMRSREGSGTRLANARKLEITDSQDDFEVYNIETALPQMNWDMLEQHLQAAANMEKNRLETCKNDREEIRRRLAMAIDEDLTYSGDDEAGESGLSPRKQRLQARLQGVPSGMQICFMNEDLLDDGEEETVAAEVNDDTPVDEDVGSSLTETIVPPPNHPCFAGEIEKFTSKQTQLQSEATLALAQASTMARMQLEVEKQTKKKSPVADMVGIPTLGNGRRLRLNRSKLQEMNIAQLQVLVNDLHSQIELLNEDLVHLLIERDDLHMEQDSMLVDIEDLTSHCHDPKTTNNNKSTQNNNRPANRRDRHK